MAEQFYVLDEKSRREMRDMLDWFHQNRNRLTSVHTEDPDGYAPEVYIARTPVGGIQAMSGVTPGSAECPIYELDAGTLTLSQAIPQPVYNLSDVAIEGSIFVLLARDKFGTWVVAAQFEDVVTGTGTGTGAAPFTNPCPLAALRTSDCLLVTTPDGSATLSYDDGLERWTSADQVSYPIGFGTLQFWYADGRTRMSLDGMELLGCGDGTFVGGPLTGHDDQDSPLYCDGETFTLTVECAECPETGTGTGTGTSGGGGGDIIVTGCCNIPSVVTMTMSVVTGTCSCMTGGSFDLTYDISDGRWKGTGSFGACGNTVHMELYCSEPTGPTGWAMDLEFSPSCGGDLSGIPVDDAVCDPLSLDFLVFFLSECGCEDVAQIRFLVTE
jgi:hypothetical protein